MDWSNHLHLFLYLLRSTQTISALSFHRTGNLIGNASPTLILPQPLNETSQAENLEYQCTQEGPPTRNRPSGLDCIHLINYLLPIRHDQHEFYRGSVQDDQNVYQLPWQEHSGTCYLEVDLVVGFTTEIISWLLIAVRARQLVEQCVYEGHYLGGLTRMGTLGGISITVVGTLREPLEGNTKIS